MRLKKKDSEMPCKHAKSCLSLNKFPLEVANKISKVNKEQESLCRFWLSGFHNKTAINIS